MGEPYERNIRTYIRNLFDDLLRINGSITFVFRLFRYPKKKKHICTITRAHERDEYGIAKESKRKIRQNHINICHLRHIHIQYITYTVPILTFKLSSSLFAFTYTFPHTLSSTYMQSWTSYSSSPFRSLEQKQPLSYMLFIAKRQLEQHLQYCEKVKCELTLKWKSCVRAYIHI